MLPVAGAAAALLMVVVGAFGTGQLPLATRLGFWAVLMAWNVEGISCMSPRAPTQLLALGSSPLSAMPCALKWRQSKPIPK